MVSHLTAKIKTANLTRYISRSLPKQVAATMETNQENHRNKQIKEDH